MKVCALCGSSVGDDTRFCPSCGVLLDRPCSQCGAINNARAMLCGACGTRLTTTRPVNPTAPVRAPRESRRIVTVLFADVVGYTSLVEAHGNQTETVRSLLRDCFDALSQDVLAHGGIVEKFIGDAICALFGAPTVHEDDPVRALSTALAMQRSMERLNAARAASDPKVEALSLRIGVSTGEVVGGSAQQAGQEQYSVTGDAVNTASRLQTAAEPGQTLVGPTTEQLTRDQFEFEPAGPLKLKGKRAAVNAFLLLAHRGNLDRIDGDLINRRRELEHLGYCLRLAGEGGSQLVEITGDAGVGKSRLVHAFAEQVDSEALILRGDCPTTMAEALHPFLAIARGLLSQQPDGELAAALQPAVATLNEVVAGTSAAVGDDLSEAVAVALQSAIDVWSRHEPVLLMVENVHRADPDSLVVLQALIHRVQEERVVLLWTRRSGEELIVQADCPAEYTRMALRPLGKEDSSLLLRQHLNGTAISGDLEQRIIERSGGNPLFLEAMIRAIQDEGSSPGDGQLSSIDIPTTVQGLVQARLDSMPEPERLVAQEAAVAGRDFDGRLLQKVDLFGLEVDAALQSLVRRGMIDHVGGSSYRFRHVLTQEVCYDTMLQTLRAELHREIADAIVDLYPERAIELAPYRADHYAKAGDTDRAVEILVEAGVSET